ncbi:hypothetical protein HPS174_1204, partial [Glaesserella parasuis 174]
MGAGEGDGGSTTQRHHLHTSPTQGRSIFDYCPQKFAGNKLVSEPRQLVV